MNIFKKFGEELVDIVEDLMKSGALPAGLDVSRLAVEPPREAAHGDLATNAAMVLAKPAGMKPRDIAGLIAGRLEALPAVDSVEIAGPGFINMRLDAAIWHECLVQALQAGRSWGDSTLGAGRKVNVEYVSANPTGPLHIGHARGTVVGDVLASLLAKAGYDVAREYYINDAGAQVDALAWAAYWRYLQARGADVSEETIAALTPTGTLEYRGEYLIPVGEALAEKYGDSLTSVDEQTGTIEGRAIDEWLPEIRAFSIDAMMELIREDLKALGVEHDTFTYESRLVEEGKVEQALAVLEDRGLIYTGVLEPPKGRKPDDWEPRPQTLFRATDFGDDVDRPLRKSDGSWTYFTPDIAYHLDKYTRGFAIMIDVWGADHAGYVKRMKAAVQAVTEGQGALDVKICQMVRLLDKGEPLKMSKRAGTFVTVRELVDAVGPDVVRYIMLTRKNDAPLDFDLTAVTEQSRDNPVWYVQYASARCNSVRRMAGEAFPNHDMSLLTLAGTTISCLTDESELTLIRMIANWPRLVESAAEAHEPHRIAIFLYNMAAAFHGLWTKGKENPALRFVVEGDETLTMARMALVRGVEVTIAAGLDVFGIEPLEEMR